MTAAGGRPYRCLTCGAAHQSVKGYCSRCIRFVGLQTEALCARILWLQTELDANTDELRRRRILSDSQPSTHLRSPF